MKGTHITIQAKCVNVLEFDEVNKMAYTDFGEGDIHWVGEHEYKNWATPTYIPDTPAQMVKEVEKLIPKVPIDEVVEVIIEEPVLEILEESNAVIEKAKRPYKKKSDAADKK